MLSDLHFISLINCKNTSFNMGFKETSCHYIKQRIPMTEWGPKYNSKKFISDAIAGITVGLTVMPQALAYATLGGLEPQYGLYSAFVGCFVYTIFGSCKDITIGPTALMALMTYQQVIGKNTDYAILLCFLSGIVQVLMAVLNLGVLVDFISIPVTVGFTSATSVIIGASQLKSLLGIKVSSSGFLDTISKVFQNLDKTRLSDALLGFGCIVILMLLRVSLNTVFCYIKGQKQSSNIDSCLWLSVKMSARSTPRGSRDWNWHHLIPHLHPNAEETRYILGCNVFWKIAEGLMCAAGYLLCLCAHINFYDKTFFLITIACFEWHLTFFLAVTIGFMYGERNPFTNKLTLVVGNLMFMIVGTVQLYQALIQEEGLGFNSAEDEVVYTPMDIKLKDLKLHKEDAKPTSNQKILQYLMWLVSTSRNAFVVIICSTVAYLYETNGTGSPFLLTGTVKPGLPDVKLPPFHTVVNNRTVEFGEMLSDLGSSVILVPIIAVLGNVAIAKAFASGTIIDATQELFTLSMCNVIGSFFSSMPITGSFSRSAVNHASGVQTPFGGVITGLMVLLALTFLTPYFAFIPKASLAAVIISAVVFMIEYEVVKPMWRSSKKDLISTFATFVFCLIIGVEYGILVGVGINIIFLLYPSARPTVYVEKIKTAGDIEYMMITPGNSLYFPAVDFIKTSVGKAGVDSKHSPIVVDCRFILGADFTAAKGISALIRDFSLRKQPLYFLNTRQEVLAVFQGVLTEDFKLKHFGSKEELETFIEEHHNTHELDRLLGETLDRQLDELNEVYTNGDNKLNHRKGKF
ncbi:unnamed protein product [Brassicogethes aeneus]|uniref:SLC26A/SulP transporter domain-containing protein n=1 Tax=Brassicogethes aeneus TaxID=1431903 RepID=A0A9P0BHK8_BRAAE|nr:unnamed protein product [Brassicogethes aeneus]